MLQARTCAALFAVVAACSSGSDDRCEDVRGEVRTYCATLDAEFRTLLDWTRRGELARVQQSWRRDNVPDLHTRVLFCHAALQGTDAAYVREYVDTIVRPVRAILVAEQLGEARASTEQLASLLEKGRRLLPKTDR